MGIINLKNKRFEICNNHKISEGNPAFSPKSQRMLDPPILSLPELLLMSLELLLDQEVWIK